MGKGECQMCFGKKTEKLSFFAKYCPKKMAKSPKNHSKPLNWILRFLIDLEPVVVLHKNRINPTKRCGGKYIHREENREMSRVGKNEIIFTCPSANRLRSARPANALHLKTTSARLPIYDRAYPEMHWSVSPGSPVVVMKSAMSLFFVKPHKKSAEVSRSVERS